MRGISRDGGASTSDSIRHHMEECCKACSEPATIATTWTLRRVCGYGAAVPTQFVRMRRSGQCCEVMFRLTVLVEL